MLPEETKVASARSPRRFASPASIRTSAEAPSLSGEAFPAVTVPSAWKTGFRRPSDSRVESARGPSSELTVIASPFRCGIATGTSSASNFPARWAATARWWERSANSSWSSRLTSYLAATFSAVSPIWRVP